MKGFLAILIILALAVIGGGAFLASWDIPAPTERVEKTISTGALSQ